MKITAIAYDLYAPSIVQYHGPDWNREFLHLDFEGFGPELPAMIETEDESVELVHWLSYY